MATRLDLHYALQNVTGLENLYFQPPEGMKLKYPCVVYELAKKDVLRADDKVYQIHNPYTVTLIDLDAESDIPNKMLKSFQYCSFERRFIASHMYHDVFTIYY